MRTRILTLIAVFAAVCAASAQRGKKSLSLEELEMKPLNEADTTALKRMAAHVAVFGNQIPQEKVFLHLDNTCYFKGDTIWFAAYSQQTNTSLPSTVSRVLYVELLTPDGYLMERQLIKMENGRGNGQFVLDKTPFYSGYYELRAYTRWQLNFGASEHEHTRYAEDWFFSKNMAKEYYVDYDKLYSRVFPVYDKPEEPGEYVRDMTTRPMRRYFKDDVEPPALVLSLFPEGGHLVAGAPNCVAFEAANEDGEWKEGRLELTDSDGKVVAEVRSEHRGRGTFTFTPEKGERYTARFYLPEIDTIAEPGRRERKHLIVREKLPKVEETGAALHVEQTPEGWQITVTPTGEWAGQALGLTVMHEGVLTAYRKVQDAQPMAVADKKTLLVGETRTFNFRHDQLSAGVNQVTVFDSDGQILADRLFFETKPRLFRPSLSVSGLKERYKAFEPIDFTLNSAPDLAGEIIKPVSKIDSLFNRLDNKSMDAVPATVSLSVRDAVMQDYTYDSGNIMTEMLLASEIKGYVPQPDWYFQADDEEHHRALDLLMLTQGWRRFEWQTMALPYAFTLNHPAEYTQVLNGEVYKYTAFSREDPYDIQQDIEAWTQLDLPEKEIQKELVLKYGMSLILPAAFATGESESGDDLTKNVRNETHSSGLSTNLEENDPDVLAERTDSELASSRFLTKVTNLKKEVLVHAEFYRPGDDGLEGEIETTNGLFTIQAPDFEGSCFMMLSASDSTKWKQPKKPAKSIYRRIRQTHQWVNADEDSYPEFSVRLKFPYPHFVKPYNFYQKQMAEHVDEKFTDDLPGVTTERLHRQLNAITVRARRGGLRRFDITQPAFGLDAYDAFNLTVDEGFYPAHYTGVSSLVPNLARAFVGDMNQERAYGVEVRLDGYHMESNYVQPPAIRAKYTYLSNLDSVFIYTDYQPREEGSERYYGDNQPTVTVNVKLMPNDSKRYSYRDRRLVLDGFSAATDFYHPNYSKRQPKPEEQKDYRRTLYWNPALPLDPSGKTSVSLFNNGKLTTVNVSAAGMDANGQWLYLAE